MNRMENVTIRQWVACRRTLGDVWLRSHQSCYQPAKMHHCENTVRTSGQATYHWSTVTKVLKGEDLRKLHWLQPPWKWGTGMHMIMAMHCKVLLSLLMHRVVWYDQGRCSAKMMSCFRCFRWLLLLQSGNVPPLVHLLLPHQLPCDGGAFRDFYDVLWRFSLVSCPGPAAVITHWLRSHCN